jgi:uncharacterized membrane protein
VIGQQVVILGLLMMVVFVVFGLDKSQKYISRKEENPQRKTQKKISACSD